jgi:RecB family exonuclease
MLSSWGNQMTSSRRALQRLTMCVLLMIGLVLIPARLTAQVPPSVDYDTFWKQDLQGRLGLFNAITPENKAAIVRTHAQRWLDANRARLTTEQITLMEENVSFTTADLYRQSRNKKSKELETRTAAIFTRDDMGHALTIYGLYIPKK